MKKKKAKETFTNLLDSNREPVLCDMCGHNVFELRGKVLFCDNCGTADMELTRREKLDG